MSNAPLAPQSLMGDRAIRKQTSVVSTFTKKSCEHHHVGTPFCIDMKRTKACVNMKTNDETVDFNQRACTCIETKEFIEIALSVEAQSIAPLMLIQPSFLESNPLPSLGDKPTVSSCNCRECSAATVTNDQTLHPATFLRDFQDRVLLMERKHKTCLGRILGEKIEIKKARQS